jgi:hypothetical protein
MERTGNAFQILVGKQDVNEIGYKYMEFIEIGSKELNQCNTESSIRLLW